jgi:hypothetical protein
LNEATQNFGFSLTVLAITSGACLFLSWLMDYPPLFYIISIGIFIVTWYPATIDLIRKQRGYFESTRVGLLWSMVLIFIVFLSAGAAYTLIDTDWFLVNTKIQGDLPYYVGCTGAAVITGYILASEVKSIERGNLLIVEKFVQNTARVLTVVIVPWIILLVSLWITAFNKWHPLGAWALSFFLAFAAYSVIDYALFSQRRKKITERGLEAGTRDEAEAILSKLRKTNEAGMIWGGTRLPFKAATGHFLAVGTTGSGKTVTIKSLLNSVIHSVGIRETDHRAILLDAKRELFAYLLKIGVDESLIYSLDPFDRRGARWDIAKDITTPTQAKQLASALVVMPEKEGDNSYFGKAARRVLAGIIDAFNYLSEKQQEQK